MHSPRTSHRINFWQQPWLFMWFLHWGMNLPNFLLCVFLSTISHRLQFWKVQMSDFDGREASMVDAARSKKIVNFIFKLWILYFRTLWSEYQSDLAEFIGFTIVRNTTTASELYEIAPSYLGLSASGKC